MPEATTHTAGCSLRQKTSECWVTHDSLGTWWGKGVLASPFQNFCSTQGPKTLSLDLPWQHSGEDLT